MSGAGVWLVVVSQGDFVLGVYGSALGDEARGAARKVQDETGFAARVETVVGKRPRVGQPFSRCNICQGDARKREAQCFGCGEWGEVGS